MQWLTYKYVKLFSLFIFSLKKQAVLFMCFTAWIMNRNFNVHIYVYHYSGLCTYFYWLKHAIEMLENKIKEENVSHAILSAYNLESQLTFQFSKGHVCTGTVYAIMESKATELFNFSIFPIEIAVNMDWIHCPANLRFNLQFRRKCRSRILTLVRSGYKNSHV